ncbi:MAG: Lhr family helicase, partial [Gaiellaceae bacterium]
WMDGLCAAGELVWIGAGALGRRSGRVALYFREDVRLLGPPPPPKEAPEGKAHDAIRERLGAGACFFTDLLVDVAGITTEELQEALWDLVWAGEVTNDAFAPLRARRLTAVASQRLRSRRFAARRRPAQEAIVGRWSLTEALFHESPQDGPRLRAQAELMLERYGIVTRETVLAEGVPGGFSTLYGELSNLETLGTARRGYFVEGLGGAQFALPGAVERLRELRSEDEPEPLVLAAADPAQPYGAALAWPATVGESKHRPGRKAGALAVLVEGGPVLYVERGGRSLLSFSTDREELVAAAHALAGAVHEGWLGSLAVERADGVGSLGSDLAEVLTEAGFRVTPKGLRLRA